ncbi:MAG: hypothetical protein IMY73_02055 [Bacteroidetes bacterium]|nr:hypothetical protein [Bacteroidota bacterium]
MFKKNLVLCCLLLLPSFLLAQQTANQELTFGAYAPRTMMHSYNTMREAKAEKRADRECYLENSNSWNYITLNSLTDFTPKLLADNSEGWKTVNGKIMPTAKGDGVMVYRTQITLKKISSFRQVFLYVGNASALSEIYVNEKLAGKSFDSNSPTEYDITSFVKEDLNIITIVCYGSSKKSKIAELYSDTVGVQGDIYAYTKDKVHIFDIENLVTISRDSVQAVVETKVIVNSFMLNKKEFRIDYSLYSPFGERVENGYVDSDIEMKNKLPFSFSMNIKEPLLWSSKNPDIYTLYISIIHRNRVLEVVRRDIAITNIEVSEKQLVVNDEIQKIVAVNYTPKTTLTLKEAIFEMQQIKSIGVNTLICSSPMNENLLIGADRAGLYVVTPININNSSSGADLSVGGSLANSPEWLAVHRQRVENYICRQKSHPSIIAWSLIGGGANGYNIYESYLYAKKLDVNRSIINKFADGEWNNDIIFEIEKNIVGEWKDGDLLTSKGTLSAKAYKLMETQSPIYVRKLEQDGDLFKIINNTEKDFPAGALLYRLSVNDIIIKEGVNAYPISAKSATEMRASTSKVVPMHYQIKYGQELRSNRKFKLDFYVNGQLLMHYIL